MLNIKRYIHKYNIYNKQIIFMGNISDKTDLTQHNELLPTNNWISQINAGGQIYDIATHHNITFVDGQGGTKTTWNGLSDIEVIIPSITDIVQSPIEFAGTVGADGKVKWNAQHTDGPKTGYLVFVTESCEFEGYACEAGDMAIYDGEKWNIVSGENQVEIVGNNGEAKTTVMIGAAQDVLTVEGKTLALTLDYADLNDNHLSVTTGKKDAKVTLGEMTVGSVGIKLNKADDQKQTITGNVTVSKATKLTNGDVTISGGGTLVTGVDFGTFNQGAMPEIVKNTQSIDFSVTGGSLSQTTDEHFVTSVSLDNVTFDSAKQGDNGAFALVGGITSGSGQSFVTGINGAAEFTVAGCLQPTDGATAKYVNGLSGGLTEVVTSITDGSFVFDSAGTTFVTGFDDNSTDVISSVSVSANNDTEVVGSATVSGHVLTFGTANVTSSVSVSTSSKNLTKGGYTYTAPSATKTSFTTAGFTKASDVKYTFDTAAETTYSTTSAYYKITTPEVKVSKAGYGLSNDGMKITVGANTFAVDMTAGTLPTLTQGSVSRAAVLTGSVATGLDYEEQTVSLNNSEISLPGAYTLSTVETGGDITVGKSGAITAGEATIDLSGYITDVKVVATKTQE